MEIPKSITFTAMDTEWLVPPEVPVTVIVKVPAGAGAASLTVSDAVPVPLTDIETLLVLRDRPGPRGLELAAKLTTPLNPF